MPFQFKPSAKNIEEGIDKLLNKDETSRADMDVALERLKKNEIELREEIAERIRFEHESNALLKRYQTLMKTSIDGIHIMDIDGNLLEANNAFCRMLGYTQEEISQLNVTDWDAKFTDAELKFSFRSSVGKSATVETTHRRKDGELIEVEISSSIMMLDGQYRIFAISRDVTKRKHIENDLLQTTRQLRELKVNYESSQEAERKAIAREVHDELGQLLSALRLDISTIHTLYNNDNLELLALIQDMTELVDSAILAVRNVSDNLRPAVLEMEIVSAIDWLSSNFSARTGISCILDSPDLIDELDETLATAIFRIVQESLTNVMRHAAAHNVNITISSSDNNFCLEVKDDGKGFNMNDSRQRTSFGIFGMRERARALGGDIKITSAIDKGTIICVRIPTVSSKTKR